MQYNKPTFTYELREPGTANATFSFNDVMIDFDLSNVCNPLGDLLNGLVTLLVTPSYMWGEDNVNSVTWYSDTEAYNWHLMANDDQTLSVRVTKSSGLFDEEETELLNIKCLFADFVYGLIHELDTFIKRIGLLNYAQQWQKYEFPITYFLFLKKYLIEKGRWSQANRVLCDILSDEMLLLLA